MTEVRHIFGKAVPSAKVADPRIVAHLETLLERARTGEIRGLTYVAITEHSACVVSGGGLFDTTGDARLAQSHLLDAIREIGENLRDID